MTDQITKLAMKWYTGEQESSSCVLFCGGAASLVASGHNWVLFVSWMSCSPATVVVTVCSPGLRAVTFPRYCIPRQLFFHQLHRLHDYTDYMNTLITPIT